MRNIFSLGAICLFCLFVGGTSLGQITSDPDYIRKQIPLSVPKVLPDSDQLAGLTPAGKKEGTVARPTQCLNGMWSFCPIYQDGRLGRWNPVKVPGLWNDRSVYSGDGPSYRCRPEWYKAHRGWYFRTFSIGKEYAGKRLVLDFEAVSMYCDVYLNGKRVASHAGAFSPFKVDITKAARIGQSNELALFVWDATYALRKGGSVVHIAGHSKIYPHGASRLPIGGIWGDVMLEATPKVSINDVFVITSVRKKQLRIRYELSNMTAKPVKVRVTSILRNWADKFALEHSPEIPRREVTVKPGQTTVEEVIAKWDRPRFWSHLDPHLYELVSRLSVVGEEDDEKCTRFGFREYWVDGNAIRFNGPKFHFFADSPNMTHEQAWHRRDLLRSYFRMLKKGFNIHCVRWMEQTPLRAVTEVADEEGILLEAGSSMWSGGVGGNMKAPDVFLANAQKEIGQIVRDRRNHPSIVVWHVENEYFSGTGGNMKVWSWVRKLDRFFKTHDPTRITQHHGAGNYLVQGDQEVLASSGFDLDERAQRWTAPIRAKKPVGNYEAHIATSESNRSYEEWSRNLGRDGGNFILRARSQGYFLQMFILTTHFCEAVVPYRSQLDFGPLNTRGVKPDFVGIWHPDRPAHMGKLPATIFNNPGWFKNLPEYRLGPGAERIKNAFAPLAAYPRYLEKALWEGQKSKRPIIVMNDSMQNQDIVLTSEICIQDGPAISKKQIVSVPAGENRQIVLEFDIPQVEEITNAKLVLSISNAGNIVFHNEHSMVIYPTLPSFSSDREIQLWDPEGKTAGMFNVLAIPHRKIPDIRQARPGNVLVIGQNSMRKLPHASKPDLQRFVAEGGRLLVMQQSEQYGLLAGQMLVDTVPRTIPNYLSLFKGHVVCRKATEQARVSGGLHPATASVGRSVGGWLGSDGFVRYEPLKPNAINPAIRFLVDDALLEQRVGKGIAVHCQLTIEENSQVSPEARTLLVDMLRYLADSESPASVQATVLGMQTANRLAAMLAGRNRVLSKLSADNLPDSGVLLVMPDADVDKPALTIIREYVANGGTAVFFSPVRDMAIGDQSFRITNSTILPGQTPSVYVRGKRRRYTQGMRYGDLRGLVRGYRGPHKGWAKALVVNEQDSEIDAIAVTSMGNWSNHTQAVTGSWLASRKLGDGQLVVCQLPLLGSVDNTALKTIQERLLGTLLMNLGLPLNPRGSSAMVVRPATKVKIDGDLTEWTTGIPPEFEGLVNEFNPRINPVVIDSSMTSGFDRPDGNRDVSGLAYLMWDKDYLYFAFRVFDDVVCMDSDNPEELWLSDCVQVVVNGRQFSFGRGAHGKKLLKASLYPLTAKEKKAIRFSIRLVKDHTESPDLSVLFGRERKTVKGGYVVEGAIPRTLVVRKGVLKDGHELTIALGIEDRDIPNTTVKESRVFFPSCWRWPNKNPALAVLSSDVGVSGGYQREADK